MTDDISRLTDSVRKEIKTVTDSSPPLATDGKSGEGHKPNLILWLVITCVLLLVKGQLEHLDKGKQLEQWTYGWLQYRFYMAGGRDRPPALVINLDKPPEHWERDGRSDTVTPREPLKQLLTFFAEKGAKGVAIDVDFSPENGLPVHPDDKEFFRFCLDLSRQKNMPIALGVWRTRLQPYNWLISDEFHSLAGAYDIPKAHPEWAVRWIKPDGAQERLPSLATRLTKLDDADKDYSFSEWAIRSTSRMHYNVGYSTAYSPIDFTHLYRLREDALPTQDINALSHFGNKISGRYILLGDTYPTSPKDWFEVQKLGSIPGIFLHACSAITLLGKPLHTLTPIARVLLDIIIAGLIYLLVRVFCNTHHRTGWASFLSDESKAQYIFTLLAITIVFVIAFLFVRRTRLLWTDFVLVCLILVFHPFLDQFGHWLIKQFRKFRVNSHSKPASAASPPPQTK